MHPYLFCFGHFGGLSLGVLIVRNSIPISLAGVHGYSGGIPHAASRRRHGEAQTPLAVLMITSEKPSLGCRLDWNYSFDSAEYGLGGRYWPRARRRQGKE
jgi:hypothetical protein